MGGNKRLSIAQAKQVASEAVELALNATGITKKKVRAGQKKKDHQLQQHGYFWAPNLRSSHRRQSQATDQPDDRDHYEGQLETAEQGRELKSPNR